jgi:predicted nucleotidyltransferase
MADILDGDARDYCRCAAARRWRRRDSIESDFTRRLTMLAQQTILEAARRATAAAESPLQVFVFGSYARGDADAGSDLDLLVVEREVHDKTAEYMKLHRAVGSVGVGVDVLVFSREEFERRSQVPGTVPYWAKKEGKLLYDAAA